MNKREKKICKDKLLEMKQEIQGKLFGEGSDSFGINQKESTGNLSGVPFHLADVGTDNFDRDFKVDLAQEKSYMLRFVDTALAKVDSKEYGVCERCKKKVNTERMFAMPYVTLCIKCQEEDEKNK